MPHTNTQNTKIADINDSLRAHLPGALPEPHRLLLTLKVQRLAPEKLNTLLRQIANFNNFNIENDPFDEHDYGLILFEDEEYFFKFDYFDRSFKHHQTNGLRALTISHTLEN